MVGDFEIGFSHIFVWIADAVYAELNSTLFRPVQMKFEVDRFSQ